VWWGHYWSSTSRPWRAGLRLLLARLSDALLFYTDCEVAEYAQEGGGRRKPLVFALNNGIETKQIARLRAAYDPTLRSRQLLFVGRITAKADIALLLRALAEPPCANVRLHVIGGGDDERKARDLAATLGIANRVVWVGPSIDEAKIAAVANRCALFVYPGSVGLSLIHGLAYGLPAIVHDDRWAHMPEIGALKVGANGLVFRKGDPAALAGVIADALSDAARLSAMSAAAIETTERTFNADDMAGRFCAAIAAIRERHGAPAVSGKAQLDEPHETRHDD
jgi:glycosyltransferase involved in cell wall biosynthesis